MTTFALLFASNIFMTAAWYGRGIAFGEYCLQVPANRWGYGQFTAAQLKIAQEVITIVVFVAFAWFWLGETPRWNEAVAFGLVLAAVVVASLPV